jgi:transcriptional regulator with XRE-family HTH domain
LRELVVGKVHYLSFNVLYLESRRRNRPRGKHVKRTAAARNARVEPAEQADPSRMELRVGARLRHPRLLNRMRLNVAERAMCSEGMLSKIENDRAIPSLTTLHRLCKALNLSASSLLNNGRRDVRAIIGHPLGSGGEGVKAEVLIPHAEGRLLEGFIVIIELGGHSGGVLSHKGEEVPVGAGYQGHDPSA